LDKFVVYVYIIVVSDEEAVDCIAADKLWNESHWYVSKTLSSFRQ